MGDKIRLRNPQKFSVGIITDEKPNGLNILPGAFTMVTQDEIDYLMATSTLLSKGILRVEGAKKDEVLQTMGIEEENNANFMSDDDIKKKLSGSVNQLKKWLDSDIEPFVLERIADIAKEMNLNISKIQVLQDKLPSYNFINK